MSSQYWSVGQHLNTLDLESILYEKACIDILKLCILVLEKIFKVFLFIFLGQTLNPRPQYKKKHYNLNRIESTVYENVA